MCRLQFAVRMVISRASYAYEWSVARTYLASTGFAFVNALSKYCLRRPEASRVGLPVAALCIVSEVEEERQDDLPPFISFGFTKYLASTVHCLLISSLLPWTALFIRTDVRRNNIRARRTCSYRNLRALTGSGTIQFYKYRMSPTTFKFEQRYT